MKKATKVETPFGPHVERMKDIAFLYRDWARFLTMIGSIHVSELSPDAKASYAKKLNDFCGMLQRVVECQEQNLPSLLAAIAKSLE
jgi:hypothetical protein